MRNFSQAYIVRPKFLASHGLLLGAMQDPEYDRRILGTFLSLGVGFAASVLFFAVLGIFVDKKLGTSPLFTLLGVLIGGVGGFYSLVRKAKELERAGQEGERDREKQPNGSRGDEGEGSG